MRIFLLLFILVSSSSFSQTKLFKEVSDEFGLTYIYPGNDVQMAGGGIIVIDVNNDGWEDLFQAGGVFDSKLWLNEKGIFRDVSTEYGLDTLKGYFIQGAVSADYNNDGFQDFLIVNFGKGAGGGDKKSPGLLKNIDGKRFELISMNELLPPANYTTATWGDINNDGFSDIYITNYVASMGHDRDSNGASIGYLPICYENKLLMNQRGNGFIEMSKEYGVNDIGCGFASSLTDVDFDGDLDLLLLNDFGEWSKIGNKYFRNDYPNATFTDISVEAGFSREMYGMGIGQGDYDEDGDIDYYITNIGDNSLFRNDNGTLTDVAPDLGLTIGLVKDSLRGTSWSGLFFDYEFDGDLDLYVSKGNILALVPQTVVRDPNMLFIKDNGTFEDVSTYSGVDDMLSHRGSVIFDFDHDGDLDIASSVVKMPWGAFSQVDQKIKLYRNESDAGNFVGIQLIGGDGSNIDCFGCRVVFEQGTRKMAREVDGGSGQASQSSRIIYYGLGEAKSLDKVTIYWSNGEKQELAGLKNGSIYSLKQGGILQNKKLTKR